jgi:hypothetical protein
MKKAVHLIALLFFFHLFFSSHLFGSEIPVTQPVNSSTMLFSSETPNDTVAYLYLDPMSNTIYLSITLNDPSKVSIVILDILGTVVWTLPESTYDPGKQLLSGSLNLGYGQYIVKVLKNGYVYKTQKILVIK